MLENYYSWGQWLLFCKEIHFVTKYRIQSHVICKLSRLCYWNTRVNFHVIWSLATRGSHLDIAWGIAHYNQIVQVIKEVQDRVLAMSGSVRCCRYSAQTLPFSTMPWTSRLRPGHRTEVFTRSPRFTIPWYSIARSDPNVLFIRLCVVLSFQTVLYPSW